MDEHFVVGRDDSAQLRATVCERCGSRWYPARTVCAKCRNTPLEQVLAGPAGTVYASTVVRAGAPGFAVPYSLAYLDVDGLRVLAHLDSLGGAAQPGTRVRLQAGVIAGDPGLSAYVAVLDDEGSRDA